MPTARRFSHATSEPRKSTRSRSSGRELRQKYTSVGYLTVPGTKGLLRLLRETRMLCQPIDFADLEECGFIRKERAWYRVANLHDLPSTPSKGLHQSSSSKG